MRITDVEVLRLDVPLSGSGYKPAWSPRTTAKSWPCSVARITTDEGIVGIGAQKYWNPTLIGMIKKVLVEEICDPTYVGRFSEIVDPLRNTYGDRFCCFEVALWDLIGKETGKPIHQLLGAYRDKILAYASTAEIRKPKDRARNAVSLMERGFKAIKLRFHDPKPEKDIAVARAVREAVGDSMEIMIDANQARRPYAGGTRTWERPLWSLKTATKIVSQLEKLDVLWLEEPLPASDLEGLAKLRESTSVMIAGGEAEFGVTPFRDYVNHESLDILQPDAQYCGGILIAKKIAAIAEASGKWCIPHTWGVGMIMAADLQLIGSLPDCPYLEYPLEPPGWTVEARDSILKDPLEIDSNGYVNIPKGPGLGVELDEEALKKYRVG